MWLMHHLQEFMKGLLCATCLLRACTSVALSDPDQHSPVMESVGLRVGHLPVFLMGLGRDTRSGGEASWGPGWIRGFCSPWEPHRSVLPSW